MKKWMNRCLVGLLLMGLAVSVPTLSGCGDPKADNAKKEGFNKDALDPSKVQMQPLTGPGGAPANAGDTTTQ